MQVETEANAINERVEVELSSQSNVFVDREQILQRARQLAAQSSPQPAVQNNPNTKVFQPTKQHRK